MIINNVIRYKHADRIMYQTHVPTSNLIDMSKVITFKEENGFQRILSPKKVRSLVKYMSQPFYSLGSLLLSFHGNCTFTSYDSKNPNLGTLTFEEPGILIDGMHRMTGAKILLEKYSKNVTFPIEIYHHLTYEEMKQVFCERNSNSTKVDKSLIRLLSSHSFDTKMALELALNPKSPFFESIAIDGQRNKTSGKLITLETMARGIIELCKSPKLSIQSEEQRMTFIKTYFSMIKAELKDYWSAEFRILNSYGIGFLSTVGRELFQECITRRGLDQSKLSKYVSLFHLWEWRKISGETGQVSGSTNASVFLNDIFRDYDF